MSAQNAPSTPRVVRLRGSGVIVVCGKCLKRQDEGKGVRRALEAEAKAHATKAQKTRIIKTACLGICPRSAIVVASAAMLAVGEVMLVRDADEIPGAIDRLLP